MYCPSYVERPRYLFTFLVAQRAGSQINRLALQIHCMVTQNIQINFWIYVTFFTMLPKGVIQHFHFYCELIKSWRIKLDKRNPIFNCDPISDVLFINWYQVMCKIWFHIYTIASLSLFVYNMWIIKLCGTCVQKLSFRVSTVGIGHGPLTRYAKSRVVHARGIPGTFSPPPTSKETAS